MDYKAFLPAASGLPVSLKTRTGLREESGPEATHSMNIGELISGGEGVHVEFKSSLRVNLHTGKKDPKMELACLKTIAGFLNARGGTLIVGVSDDGETVGVEVDGFSNEDKMNLHLMNLLKDRIGAQHSIYIHPRFEDRDEARVLAVECLPSNSPAFVKDGGSDRFYTRTGAATTELSASQTQQYIASGSIEANGVGLYHSGAFGIEAFDRAAVWRSSLTMRLWRGERDHVTIPRR